MSSDSKKTQQKLTAKTLLLKQKTTHLIKNHQWSSIINPPGSMAKTLSDHTSTPSIEFLLYEAWKPRGVLNRGIHGVGVVLIHFIWCVLSAYYVFLHVVGGGFFLLVSSQRELISLFQVHENYVPTLVYYIAKMSSLREGMFVEKPIRGARQMVLFLLFGANVNTCDWRWCSKSSNKTCQKKEVVTSNTTKMGG